MNISLPIPPSVNSMFANVIIRGKQRRVKSKEYTAWKALVAPKLDRQWKASPPIAKPYGVCIRININHQSDIDNRVKPILDALVNAQIIVGDQYVNDCRIIRDRSVEACEVDIWSMGDASE